MKHTAVRASVMAWIPDLPPAVVPQRVVGAAAAMAALLLAACTSQPLSAPQRAPVEERAVNQGATAGRVPPQLLPGHENAGKPGYYTVKPGDTLTRIALDAGQNWRDVQAWNQLPNPNLIEVGQVLRVLPPSTNATAVVSRPLPPVSATPASAPAPAPAPVVTAGVTTRPIASSTGVQPQALPLPAPVAAAPLPAPKAAAPAPAPAPQSSSVPAVPAGDQVAFMWPVNGAVLSGFDETRSKGISLAGKQGDPVLAAADGRVVYAGALRAYGNLVILKHNNTFLTAYAHNQTLLVKEDQTVRKGQKIAEMGSSDADRVKLHFEVRRQGKPVDPLKYLPAR